MLCGVGSGSLVCSAKKGFEAVSTLGEKEFSDLLVMSAMGMGWRSGLQLIDILRLGPCSWNVQASIMCLGFY